MEVPSWRALTQEPPAGRHVVVLYRDEPFIGRAIATWAAEALRADGGAILVGSVARIERVRDELKRAGFEVPLLERKGRLLCIDADWLMSRFILDGAADARGFHTLVGDIVANTRASCTGPVRAWGEMVNILTSRGDPTTARRLEELWNEAIEAEDIALLCSYEAHTPDEERTLLREVMETHTHVFPQPEKGGLALIGDVPFPLR